MSDRTKRNVEAPGSSTMEVDTDIKCQENEPKGNAANPRNKRPASRNTKPAEKDNEAQDSNIGTKKIRIDANNPDKILDDQRRGRVELNKDQRDNVLRYILACHINITANMTQTVDRNSCIFRNVHLSQQVTSLFFTLHTCLRQESLVIGSLRRAMLDKDHTILIEGKEVGRMSHQHLLKTIETIANSFGLRYTKPGVDETNHWYDTASPLLCFINMFKVRMNELRIGHGSMISQKRDGTTYNFSLSQYGLYNVHHPLLEGVSIPPGKRIEMEHSLGPLTSLVCLARVDNDMKYSKRRRSAVKRDLAFVPEIDSIIEACCGKRADQVNGLFTILADILLITTSRELKRVSFPACMMYALMADQEVEHYIKFPGLFTAPTDISWFDFSGIGAGFLYKLCTGMEWQCPLRPEASDVIPELIFHSIWGTYGTDFGILEFMTSYNGWRDQSAMGESFNKFGTSAPVNFRLIPIHKYPKLSSANQTELMSFSSNPVIGKSAFSGNHTQVFTDEFFDYMESSRVTWLGVTTCIEVLKNFFMQVKERLLTRIKTNRGTTKWHAMADCTPISYGAELNEEPKHGGKLFMQSDK